MPQAIPAVGPATVKQFSVFQEGRPAFYLVTLVLALLPIERFSFPLSLKVVDLGLMVLIVYGVFWFLNEQRPIHVPLAFPAWLILLTSTIATLAGLVSVDSVIAMLQEIYLFIWFVVLVNVLVALPRANLGQLINVWSVVALLEASTVLMGMLRIGPAIFYTSPESGVVLSTGEFDRGFGTFANPNAAGAYLSISFFVLLASSWKFWIRAILGLYLLAGIFATGSMGAISSTFIALLLLVLVYILRRPARTPLLIAGLALTAAALVILLMIFIDPFKIIPPVSSAKDLTGLLALTIGRLTHSVSARVDIINKIWSIYTHYPLGIGPNTSVLFLKSMHNDYLAFLFERGPLGLIGWLWLVFATLLLPLRKGSGKHSWAEWWRTLALWGGFLASTLNAFTHEVSHFRQFWMPLSFLYAAYLIYSKTRRPAPAKLSSREVPL